MVSKIYRELEQKGLWNKENGHPQIILYDIPGDTKATFLPGSNMIIIPKSVMDDCMTGNAANLAVDIVHEGQHLIDFKTMGKEYTQIDSEANAYEMSYKCGQAYNMIDYQG